jgi:hypothetical protein
MKFKGLSSWVFVIKKLMVLAFLLGRKIIFSVIYFTFKSIMGVSYSPKLCTFECHFLCNIWSLQRSLVSKLRQCDFLQLHCFVLLGIVTPFTLTIGFLEKTRKTKDHKHYFFTSVDLCCIC